MGIKLHQPKVRTIRKNDPLFFIEDGFVRYQRAGFHIKPTCIPEYADIIKECIDCGWLEPVAYMRDHEVMFEILALPENG